MDLSLEDAAAILGKTRRQVLYLIKHERLPARKVGGRWAIDRADLPIDDEARQRSSQRQDRFKAVVEDALTPGKQRRYTLIDLKAVQMAIPIYRDLTARGNGSEPAVTHMRQCLDHLALGCHRYDQHEKATAYRAARDAASLAAMELLLGQDTEGEDPVLRRIEQDLMPAFAGLLRRSERRARREDGA